MTDVVQFRPKAPEAKTLGQAWSQFKETLEGYLKLDRLMEEDKAKYASGELIEGEVRTTIRQMVEDALPDGEMPMYPDLKVLSVVDDAASKAHGEIYDAREDLLAVTNMVVNKQLEIMRGLIEQKGIEDPASAEEMLYELADLFGGERFVMMGDLIDSSEFDGLKDQLLGIAQSLEEKLEAEGHILEINAHDLLADTAYLDWLED